MAAKYTFNLLPLNADDRVRLIAHSAIIRFNKYCTYSDNGEYVNQCLKELASKYPSSKIQNKESLRQVKLANGAVISNCLSGFIEGYIKKSLDHCQNEEKANIIGNICGVIRHKLQLREKFNIDEIIKNCLNNNFSRQVLHK